MRTRRLALSILVGIITIIPAPYRTEEATVAASLVAQGR